MTRRTRLAAAFLALAGMLFSSFAMALQACEWMAGMPPAASAGAMSHETPLGDPGCARHCNGAMQLADLAKTPPAMLSVPAAAHGISRPLERLAPLPASYWRAPTFLADPSPPLSRCTVLRL